MGIGRLTHWVTNDDEKEYQKECKRLEDRRRAAEKQRKQDEERASRNAWAESPEGMAQIEAVRVRAESLKRAAEKDPLEDYVMDLDAATEALDLKAFDQKYRGRLPKNASEYYPAAYQVYKKENPDWQREWRENQKTMTNRYFIEYLEQVAGLVAAPH
jgi:hypothetical protein